MTTQDIIKSKKQSGFTIIELLIVIVVIAILAAITYVSYTGFTQRANTTKAQANARSVQSVADAYFAENQSYPTAVDDFTDGGVATLPGSINLLTGSDADADDLTTSNGANTVWYQYCTTSGVAAAKIIYFNFNTGAAVSDGDIVYSGDNSGCSAWANPTASS